MTTASITLTPSRELLAYCLERFSEAPAETVEEFYLLLGPYLPLVLFTGESPIAMVWFETDSPDARIARVHLASIPNSLLRSHLRILRNILTESRFEDLELLILESRDAHPISRLAEALKFTCLFQGEHSSLWAHQLTHKEAPNGQR